MYVRIWIPLQVPYRTNCVELTIVFMIGIIKMCVRYGTIRTYVRTLHYYLITVIKKKTRNFFRRTSNRIRLRSYQYRTGTGTSTVEKNNTSTPKRFINFFSYGTRYVRTLVPVAHQDFNEMKTTLIQIENLPLVVVSD